jgi:DNA replication and repair protein RecF
LQQTGLETLLKESRNRDLALRYTGNGVHKDDFVFHISGYPARRYGSQGQQKSLLIALKLAQFEYTRNIKGRNPILLLDDIFDKLDENRVAQIIKLVAADDFGQVFITDTHADRINKIFLDSDIDHRIFKVEKGSFQEK